MIPAMRGRSDRQAVVYHTFNVEDLIEPGHPWSAPQSGRHDEAAGLIHFRHRDLSPTLGRWTRQDPLGYVDGGSLYLFALGSPVVNRDPSGLQVSLEEQLAHEGYYTNPKKWEELQEERRVRLYGRDCVETAGYWQANSFDSLQDCVDTTIANYSLSHFVNEVVAGTMFSALIPRIGPWVATGVGSAASGYILGQRPGAYISCLERVCVKWADE